MKTALVVGGGPAGLLAAHLAALKNYKVILIEQEQDCGGLLRSFSNGQDSFDYGTHFMRETGIAELDDILFETIRRERERWSELKHLKAGIFFNGKLNEHSSFVDLSALPKELANQAEAELRKLDPPSPQQCSNSEEYLMRTFGPTLVRVLFEPSLKKLLGVPLAALAVDAHLLFGLSRVIAFTPEESRALKANPSFDHRIAFHSSTEGISNVSNYYPKTEGIGIWAAQFTESLKAKGVKVLTNTRVEKFQMDGQRVKTLQLSNGNSLECDELLWSIAPPLALKAAGIKTAFGPPTIRVSNLYYYVFDQALLTDTFFFTCFDPQYELFRVTIYNNLRPTTLRSRHAICVEAIAGKPDDQRTKLSLFPAELKRMGLLPEDAKVLYQEGKVAQAGFPVRTPQFAADAALASQTLTNGISNIHLIGKASGGSFFLNDVFVSTYQYLTKEL